MQRFVSIWFKYLKTDWFARRQAELSAQAFVLYKPIHGRMVISASNQLAERQGIVPGVVLADARALYPQLQAVEEPIQFFEPTLQRFAHWFIRYAPIVAVDAPDGIIINASGCPHLWGGEQKYLQDIQARLLQLGYTTKIAIASTIGCAWALAHYSRHFTIVAHGQEKEALLTLPPQALRIEATHKDMLIQLGFKKIQDFIDMHPQVLQRRFGPAFVAQIQVAIGLQEEHIIPVQLPIAYQERLPCIEPIITRKGIEIALQQMLQTLCLQLQKNQKGLRHALFKGYRLDGHSTQIQISSNLPSSDVTHLYQLFALKIEQLAPMPGIELFTLEAHHVETHIAAQEQLWTSAGKLGDNSIAQLLDRLQNKIGTHKITRYLPDAHYWPERSVKIANSLLEKATQQWQLKPRPFFLLAQPEQIQVTAPIPDYPPMLFKHKNILHKITKADGPERIEQEWWLQEGLHRDYYCVEVESGNRYWVFRAGHYDATQKVAWYLHGYFV